MNWGLRDALKSAFPDIKPVSRPLFVNNEILDPNWVTGFAAAVFLLFSLFSFCFTIKSKTKSWKQKENGCFPPGGIFINLKNQY